MQASHHRGGSAEFRENNVATMTLAEKAAVAGVNTMNRWLLSVCTLVVVYPLSADAGIIFSQRSGFESAVGSFDEETFDGITVYSSGFAAIQNDQSFQNFSLRSLSTTTSCLTMLSFQQPPFLNQAR